MPPDFPSYDLAPLTDWLSKGEKRQWQNIMIFDLEPMPGEFMQGLTWQAYVRGKKVETRTRWRWEDYKTRHRGITPLFHPEDITPALLKALKNDNGPLNSLLASEILNLIQESPDSQELREKTAGELNRILLDPGFYSPERFQGVELSPETQWQLKKNPSGIWRIYLNRLLLEDTLKGSLVKFNPGLWLGLLSRTREIIILRRNDQSPEPVLEEIKLIFPESSQETRDFPLGEKYNATVVRVK